MNYNLISTLTTQENVNKLRERFEDSKPNPIEVCEYLESQGVERVSAYGSIKIKEMLKNWK